MLHLVAAAVVCPFYLVFFLLGVGLTEQIEVIFFLLRGRFRNKRGFNYGAFVMPFVLCFDVSFRWQEWSCAFSYRFLKKFALTKHAKVIFFYFDEDSETNLVVIRMFPLCLFV